MLNIDSPAALAAALEGRLVLCPQSETPLPTDWTTVGVAIDSRRVSAGDIFWALPGARRHAAGARSSAAGALGHAAGAQRDGADFVADALARGACGAVTARTGCVVPPGRWIIEVDDAIAALQRLAAWQRGQFPGTVVGVTGSVGKSTTRELIRTLLAHRHETLASPANYNNHIGLPLSMLGLQPRTEFAVLELAASGPGEIAQLASLCQPQWGVITSLADAHLAGFGSYEGVVAAKTELAAAIPEDGYLVLNGDDARLRRWAARAEAQCPRWRERICWVGRSMDCDLRAEHVRYREGQLEFRLAGIPFSVSIAGRHFLPNVLTAIAIAVRSGIDLSDAADALAGFSGLPLRCEVTRTAGVTIIDDSYNACPASMRAALNLLRETPASGRRLVLCGDMRELGEKSAELHAEIGEATVHTAGADGLFACGDWGASLAEAARRAGMPSDRVWASDDTDCVVQQLIATLRPGDALLVKASRAVGLDRVVENLKKVLEQNAKRHSLVPETLLFSLPAAGMKDLSAANRI